MAGNAAAGLDPDLAGSQIQLVVENQEIVEGELVEVGGLGHRQTGAVHEGLRLLQHHLGAAKLALGDLARIFRTPGCKPIGQG